MKNKIELETTLTEKLSFLFSFFVGLLGVLFVPYILKSKVLPYLSYPDVVSFYLMANYMVAGFFGFVMMMVMSGYVLVTAVALNAIDEEFGISEMIIKKIRDLEKSAPNTSDVLGMHSQLLYKKI